MSGTFIPNEQNLAAKICGISGLQTRSPISYLSFLRAVSNTARDPIVILSYYGSLEIAVKNSTGSIESQKPNRLITIKSDLFADRKL